MPLIRLCTRDVSYLIDKSYKCGVSTLRSIGGIRRKLKIDSKSHSLLKSFDLIK